MGWGGNGGLYAVVNVSDATQVAVRAGGACALLTSAKVQCWGGNSKGQLGAGFTSFSETARQVQGLSNVKQIAVDRDSACALLADSTVRCWGSNDMGQLGNGSFTSSSSPVEVKNLANVFAISIKHSRACALYDTGNMACWGADEEGNPTSLPARVAGVQNAAALSILNNGACVISSNGQMKCWGYEIGPSVFDSALADSQQQNVNLPNPPAAPLITLTDRSSESTSLRWDTPTSDGLPIDKYKVEWSTDGNIWNSSETTTTTKQVTGLNPATTYQLRVSAHSSAGWGLASNLIQCSTTTSPSTAKAPSSVTKIVSTSLKAKSNKLVWSGAKANGSTITKYEVRWKLSTSSKWGSFKSYGKATTATISGWLKGKKYNVQVRVTNAIGSSVSKTFTFTQTK